MAKTNDKYHLVPRLHRTLDRLQEFLKKDFDKHLPKRFKDNSDGYTNDEKNKYRAEINHQIGQLQVRLGLKSEEDLKKEEQKNERPIKAPGKRVKRTRGKTNSKPDQVVVLAES